ncbi:hypothetical protein Hdeb2414_s0008g00264741 [Helianthus debilis subsp. tardiflorus]
MHVDKIKHDKRNYSRRRDGFEVMSSRPDPNLVSVSLGAEKSGLDLCFVDGSHDDGRFRGSGFNEPKIVDSGFPNGLERRIEGGENELRDEGDIVSFVFEATY